MALGLYGPLDGLEFAEGLSETDPPFLTAQTPTPAATGVAVTADVEFTVDDLDAGVVLTSVIVTIDAGGGFITAYTSSAFQAGYSGSVTPNGGGGYAFIINPSADFPNSQLVQVRVEADDVDENHLDETYSFSTVAVASVLTLICNQTDTLRGGAQVIITMSDDLGTREESLRATRIPIGWVVNSSADSEARPQRAGLLLRSGPPDMALDNFVEVSLGEPWTSYHVSIDVEPLHPTVLTPGTETDQAYVYTTVGGQTLALILTHSATQGYLAQFGRTAPTTRAIGSTSYGVTSPGIVTLEMIRHGVLMWAFATARGVRTALGLFRGLAPTPAEVQFGVWGQDNNLACMTRFTNLYVRAAATLAGRLVENSEVVFERQIRGTVPAAEYTDLGAVPVSAFGPDDAATDPIGFTYTRPPQLTLYRNNRHTLFYLGDKQLRDIKNRK